MKEFFKSSGESYEADKKLLKEDRENLKGKPLSDPEQYQSSQLDYDIQESWDRITKILNRRK